MTPYTQTSTYNQPALRYGAIQGLRVGAALDDTSPITIPMVLNAYSGITAQGTLNALSVMPIVRADQGGYAYGGVVIGEGSVSLPRITIGGYLDTPILSGVPANLNYDSGGGPHPITAADVIVMCIEGRVSSTWQRYDPVWFRDPFGRQFNNVRFIDFQASYVEAVPGRANFTATLLTL